MAGVNTVFADVAAGGTGDVWAVGQSGCPSVQDPKPFLAHRNGSTWKSVPVPSPGSSGGFADVAVVSARDAWAVGGFVQHGVEHPLIEQWDGTRWKVVDVPGAVSGSLSSVAVVSPTDVWAAGAAPAGDLDSPIALHFDGVSWAPVAVPTPGGAAGFLTSVTSGRGGTWAVGGYRPDGGNLQPLVERWSGSVWRASTLSVGPCGGLEAVAANAVGDVWTVGFVVDGVGARPVAATRTNGSWGARCTTSGGFVPDRPERRCRRIGVGCRRHAPRARTAVAM
jgi:hypothetical protein